MLSNGTNYQKKKKTYDVQMKNLYSLYLIHMIINCKKKNNFNMLY